MYELIICEKPMAALKIAAALADKSPAEHKIGKVSYYELTHKGKKILVGCAVGHLYGISEKEKSGLKYPVGEIEWKPASEIKKAAAFTKPYLTVLKKLAKLADSFTIGCDYDIEGSVIGFNCIHFICKQKDAKRMKFSTLTKDELIQSYENASPHLDFPLIYAGQARHILDYMWGMSLSRALMSSIKAANSFRIMSIGRVQGPSLKLIVEKEKEIQSFKSEPFWVIELKGKVNSKDITAYHQLGNIFDKKKVAQILKNTKGKKAIISSINKKEFLQAPPTPFDLTTLQLEAYRCFGISPKEILSIAQELYTAGLISYPRTSSQKLPPSLGYKKILNSLSKIKNYSLLANTLLKKTNLKPNEGEKTDPAHPSIFPTGEQSNLKDRSFKIYDLIVKRFLATFAEPAKRQTLTIEIDVNKEIFKSAGTTTLIPGWHSFYSPYINLKEQELPEVKEHQEVKTPKISSIDKETQPPKRFTEASIIKELEKRNLGTKSTRASIIDALYQRHYIQEKAIQATQLGLSTIKTLEQYSPEILDEQLTRHFEEEMEQIREETKKKEEVLEEAREVLTKLLNKFRKKEKEIGEELLKAVKETQQKATFVGPCTKCKGNFRIMFSKKNRQYFLACDQYPKCKTTLSIPKYALPKPTDKKCPECNSPILLMIRKGKRPYDFCINPSCPSKKKWLEEQNKKSKEEQKEESTSSQ